MAHDMSHSAQSSLRCWRSRKRQGITPADFLSTAAKPSIAIFPRAMLRWRWVLIPYLQGGFCYPRFARLLWWTAEAHFGHAVQLRLDSRQGAREDVGCAGATPPAIRPASVRVARPPLQQEAARTVCEFYLPHDAWRYAASRTMQWRDIRLHD